MTLTGDLDKAVAELRKEREQSLERLVDRLKGLTATRKGKGGLKRRYRVRKVET
jgi:hypothetical protein